MIALPICNQQIQYQSGSFTLESSLSLDDYLGHEKDLLAVVQHHQTKKRGYKQVFTSPYFCVRIPYSVYSKVGAFDTGFGPGGAEDDDYCLRAYLKGFAVFQALDSYLLHFQGRSTWLGAESPVQTKKRNEQYIQAFENKWGKNLTRAAILKDSQAVTSNSHLNSLLSQRRLPELVSEMLKDHPGSSPELKLWEAQVGAVYCVYEDERWLKQSLASVYGSCQAIYFLIGNRPWNGEKTDNSRTLELIKLFPDPDKKIKVYRGDWPAEEAQRNAGLELLNQAGLDYCLVVDADEIYESKELRSMIQHASLRRFVPAWRVKLLTYWKNEQYRIDPPENYRAVNLIRLGKERFDNRRELKCHSELLPEDLGACHHMSYARTDEEVLRKISTFSHASEVVPNWYQSIWLAWEKNKEMENIHPCWPEAYKKAISVNQESLPSVLRSSK